MKKLLLLFIFPVYLFSVLIIDKPAPSSGDGYPHAICSNGFEASPTPFNVRDVYNKFRKANAMSVPHLTYNLDDKSDYVILSYYYYVDTYGTLGGAWVKVFYESYHCNQEVVVCDINETKINGECIDTLPQSCESLHGADWLENSASNAEDCGSLVDGQNYSNASFHDAYDNYKAVCCVLPIKPSFECSELGDNWSSRSESSESSCNALVDGVTIDSSNYITGDNVSPTCCIHLMPDNNATGPVDNNETTPPTDTNDSTPPTDSNDTAPQTDNNEDSNSTPQTLDDAIDQLRNDNNLNASNAQGKYDDLIIGLRDVKENQTQIAQVAHEDAQEIKDAISNEDEEEDSENRVSEAQEGNSEILDLGENAIASYTEGFDSLQNIVNGYSAPVISASGSCDLSATIFNRSVSFSTGFASLIPTFRPFVMFILSVSFSLLLIKYTILAWRDVIKFASQTFGR